MKWTERKGKKEVIASSLHWLHLQIGTFHKKAMPIHSLTTLSIKTANLLWYQYEFFQYTLFRSPILSFHLMIGASCIDEMFCLFSNWLPCWSLSLAFYPFALFGIVYSEPCVIVVITTDPILRGYWVDNGSTYGLKLSTFWDGNSFHNCYSCGILSAGLYFHNLYGVCTFA